jgi:hypothetical protein
MGKSGAQVRFDTLLEAEQPVTLEEIEQTLRDARRQREARYKQAIRRLERDDGNDTPEVLTHND